MISNPQPERVICHEVSDRSAVSGCLRFLSDHRLAVEPACGAVLSSVYAGLLPRLDLPPGPVVVVVCGGNIVNIDMINKWREMVAE